MILGFFLLNNVVEIKNTSKQKLLQILQKEDAFQGLSEQALQRLMRNAQFSRYHAHQHILKQQQVIPDLYVLLVGTLQVGWLQTNGELIVNDFISMQSVFNLAALLQNQPLNYDYFAASHVEVAIISGQVYLEELQCERQALWQVIQLLSRRMYVMFEQNRYVRTASLSQRIARHLIRLYEQYGSQAQIPLKLSQQEFAELFNVSRQTLNKHVQQLVQAQIIAWNYSQIYILDLNGLKQLSDLN